MPGGVAKLRRALAGGSWLPWAALLVYGGLAAGLPADELIWEEPRYLWQAAGLLRGGPFNPNPPEILNGPGYPLLLAPAAGLGAPVTMLRLVNAVLMALAVAFMHRAVAAYAGRGWATAMAGILLFHPVFLRVAPRLMTEALTLACLSVFTWAFCAWLREREPSRWLWTTATASLAGLVLTRVMFGPVLQVTTLGAMLLFALRPQQRPALGRALRIMVPALLLCAPWLLYTHSVTGRLNSWSTVGSEMLYWSTAPGPQRGDYVYPVDWKQRAELRTPHREFLESIESKPAADRDAALRDRTVEHLRSAPSAVLVNWVHNLSRLAFGYPRTLRAQDIGYVPLFLVNVPLLLLVCAALGLALRRPALLPTEVRMLLGFVLLYLGAHSLLPSLARYGIVAWPVLGLATACVLHRYAGRSDGGAGDRAGTRPAYAASPTGR